MPKEKKDEINFEINLTKAKWEPKKIEDIPKVISRAFETELSLRDIRPLVGTDHVKTWPMNEDSDIPVFIKEKSMLNEAFAEKVIRFRLPKNIMPPNWKPKKVKILAKGARIAKYFGEDSQNDRTLQVSLKLFECGHFYLKQTLPGSGISPHWTICEGTWQHTENGMRLTYLIRYSWQICQKPAFDLNIEAVPDAGWSSTLAWSGERSESQLNGNIPAVVGTDRWAWIEVYRDADSTEKVAARFNDQMDDDSSWKDSSWKTGLKAPKGSPQVGSESANASKGGDATLTQRREASGGSAATSSEQRSSAAPGSTDSSTSSSLESEESAIPLYVALAFFVVILAYFAWQKWQEVTTSWSKARETGELW